MSVGHRNPIRLLNMLKMSSPYAPGTAWLLALTSASRSEMESRSPEPSNGSAVSGTKQRKCGLCQAREGVWPLPTNNRHAASAQIIHSQCNLEFTGSLLVHESVQGRFGVYYAAI
jgi:hypothetical protein